MLAAAATAFQNSKRLHVACWGSKKLETHNECIATANDSNDFAKTDRGWHMGHQALQISCTVDEVSEAALQYRPMTARSIFTKNIQRGLWAVLINALIRSRPGLLMVGTATEPGDRIAHQPYNGHRDRAHQQCLPQLPFELPPKRLHAPQCLGPHCWAGRPCCSRTTVHK